MTYITEIQKNIETIREEIIDICGKCHRDPETVKLLAVSKTFPVSDIMDAADAGQKAFGENRPQELRDKIIELSDRVLEWHFIGSLQKNKVKYVAGKVALIHSVDELKIAEEIDKRAAMNDTIQDILVEVNVSGEGSKHGLTLVDAERFIDSLQSFQNLRVCGLMTMAPYTDDEAIIRNTFSGLRRLRDTLHQTYHTITELSMGMTNDYRMAIEEGSTIIRVGSAIFGTR
ncbi:MAG TPA: YggS family pyridoxal phosphate-dependent enzyme [Thermotogota bacterium]|nr:YggS family pyridoxal phosphate-dependent enzyme [Thermotogota bacterium]